MHNIILFRALTRPLKLYFYEAHMQRRKAHNLNNQIRQQQQNSLLRYSVYWKWSTLICVSIGQSFLIRSQFGIGTSIFFFIDDTDVVQ